MPDECDCLWCKQERRAEQATLVKKPPITVCDTKKYCDTEFEAQVVAAKAEGKTGVEFVPYQCGSHWHITHKNPLLSRGAGKKYWRCPKCKLIFKRYQAKNHVCKEAQSE